MTQTIEEFAAACRAALMAENTKAGREKMCDLVKSACADPAFLDTYVVADAPERKVLYEDPDLGFCILAHSYVGAKSSPPHDHGPTWAIYGQGTGETIMTDFECLVPATDETPGQVRPVRSYTLSPGMAYLYEAGALHAPLRHDSTRLIRIEGIDVSKIKRKKYVVAEPAVA